MDIRAKSLVTSIFKSRYVRVTNDINKTSASILKGWLFEFYCAENDLNSYECVNERYLKHKQSVLAAASSYDIEHRNELLLRQEVYRDYVTFGSN